MASADKEIDYSQPIIEVNTTFRELTGTTEFILSNLPVWYFPETKYYLKPIIDALSEEEKINAGDRTDAYHIFSRVLDTNGLSYTVKIVLRLVLGEIDETILPIVKLIKEVITETGKEIDVHTKQLLDQYNDKQINNEQINDDMQKNIDKYKLDFFELINKDYKNIIIIEIDINLFGRNSIFHIELVNQHQNRQRRYNFVLPYQLITQFKPSGKYKSLVETIIPKNPKFVPSVPLSLSVRKGNPFARPILPPLVQSFENVDDLAKQLIELLVGPVVNVSDNIDTKPAIAYGGYKSYHKKLSKRLVKRNHKKSKKNIK